MDVSIFIVNIGAPNGKLRLLHEVAPIAFLIEQAGGKASTGNTYDQHHHNDDHHYDDHRRHYHHHHHHTHHYHRHYHQHCHFHQQL